MDKSTEFIEQKLANPETYWDWLIHLWAFEVFKVEGQAITLGKIVVGLSLLVLGYFVSHFLSRTVRARFLSRLNIDSSLQYTWQKILFYIFFTGFFLFVLQLLSIPITIFAVVGGAVAIGIGFGSQNLVNNFISGLIVMVERPVRLNDLIEIEGQMGRIENIGTRSTMIRTIENKQVIIPNSKFLDTSFINWTLSDTLVSSQISVGVAYGSDPHLVSKILIEAASLHDRVEKENPPTALLMNFGDSSLDFNLIFWHRIDPLYGPARIRSEIRMKILELFEKNKVSIPFPHREVILRKNEERS